MKYFTVLSLVLSIAFLPACSLITGDKTSYYSSNNSKDDNSITTNEISPEYGIDDPDSKNSNYYEEEAKTITDLFDGERKIWFGVHGMGKSELAFHQKISVVLVTENKTVTDMYYTLNADDGYTMPTSLTPLDDFNPFTAKCYTLADMSGLSDDEILNLISSNYADGKVEYHYMQTDIATSQTITRTSPKVILPWEIKYGGKLDNSGNRLESEYLLLFDFETNNGYTTQFPNEFDFDEFISPTQIKDDEYIGIYGYNSGPRLLATRNTYNEIQSPDFDSADGVYEYR